MSSFSYILNCQRNIYGHSKDVDFIQQLRAIVNAALLNSTYPNIQSK